MRVKGKWSKGEMARTIVVYLIQLITTVIVWACALKTVAVLIAVIRSPARRSKAPQPQSGRALRPIAAPDSI